jgi:hypothetical protein
VRFCIAQLGKHHPVFAFRDFKLRLQVFSRSREIGAAYPRGLCQRRVSEMCGIGDAGIWRDVLIVPSVIEGIG